MSKTLTEIAQDLRRSDKKVQLIYAFNGTGKTRLSREFKQLIAPKNGNDDEGDQPELARNKILYYNAHTEDLFYWDNDLENDVEPKLRIQPNSFIDWVLREQGQEPNVIEHFQRYADEKLTPNFSPDFSEVAFSFERGNDERSEHIKISKAEESCLVWSVFYSLLDQVIETLNVAEPGERETNQFDQLKYVFIDDPVSSLDENHLIELAIDLAKLISRSESELKFIVSTHNPLFYKVLFSEVNATGYILRRHEDGAFDLEKKGGASNQSFSYHLHIKHLIEEAIEQKQVQRFHFNLLRNLYEKAAHFLGYPQWSDLLPENQKAYSKKVMHFYSHRNLSNEEVAEPTEPEKETVRHLLEHLIKEHRFWQQEEQNG